MAWLESAYGDGAHESAMIRIRAARTHIGDIQLRFATLFARLGPALDGPGALTEADAWYCILEGTREPSVAGAQALAITELVARAATGARLERGRSCSPPTTTRRLPPGPDVNLYERGRSLGIGVQVSAQSWQGLGPDDDERYRIAATADGGIWLLHTPYPEPVSSWPGPAGCWNQRTSSSAPPGAMKAPPGSSTPGPPTPASSAPSRPGRRATSTMAPPPSSRSPGPKPSPLSLPPAPVPSAVIPPPAPTRAAQAHRRTRARVLR